MSDSVDEGVFEPKQTPVAPTESEAGEDKVVSARGTEDGLVLRIDGGASWGSVLTELEQFLGGRKRFFEGGQVLIEWVERIPSKEQCTQLEEVLREQYGLSIASRRRRNQLGAVRGSRLAQSGKEQDMSSDNERSHEEPEVHSRSLVEEIEQIASGIDRQPSGKRFEFAESERMVASSMAGSSMQELLTEDLFADEDANAKVVFGTVRSGQRVETPFSLIVVGDVNPGADLIAGGDIIVLGSLRGTAHASAYDDDGFDTVIVALHMRPMQLRIGSIISRGSDEEVRQPEIARIENRRIVVEAFNSRAAYWRKS